jgi:hypothetical protein
MVDRPHLSLRSVPPSLLRERERVLTTRILALSPDARTALSEEYLNSLNFADGEIYRKVRYYQTIGRKFIESKWRAYLSKDKQKDLRRLLKRGDYVAALDKLRFIHGLWAGFSFGKVHWWLGMKCYEVNY